MPLTWGRYNMTNSASDPFFSISHLDGKTAVRRNVEIQTIGQNFYLLEQEHRYGPFAFERLQFTSQNGDAISYGYDDIDGWRLTVSGPIPAELQSLLPPVRHYGSWVDTLGLGAATGVFASISAVVLFVGLTAPQWLAPLIPQSFENNLGDALVGDFGGRICDTPKGKAALQKLVDSLDNKSDELQVEVVNIKMLNAVALPGGKVFLFEGLVQQAASVDEVAGVLGHEIGHVRERHVMQSLLRQLGLSLILGGMNENVGGVISGALANSYGRDAESEADAYSIDILSKANISPLPTKGFFEKLAKMTNEDGDGKTIASYMSSHPLSTARANEFDKSYDKSKNYQPALTTSEWNAIKSMCKEDKDVKSGFGIDFLDK